MEKIQNDNCAGLCAVYNCPKKYTQFDTITYHGLLLYIGLCDKHADMAVKNAGLF